MIFQPYWTATEKPVDSYSAQNYLIYAQRFDCSHSTREADKVSGLFYLKRARSGHGERLGAVVWAGRVRCSVDVAPRFGKEIDEHLEDPTTSLELASQFCLNKYSDKEIFHLFRKDPL